MKAYEELEKDELKNLLNANWMTHDATWFAGCLEEFGIDKTNLLNKNAVRTMAKIEVKRLKKILGLKRISNITDLQDFLRSSFQIIKGVFMNFEMNFSEDGKLEWKVPKCFAFEGVRRLGVIDKYECGIVERIFGWLDELEINYSIQPKPVGCSMHKYGVCEMTIEFYFNGEKL